MTTSILAGLIGIFVVVKLAFFSPNRLMSALNMLPLILLGYIAADQTTKFGGVISEAIDIIIMILNSAASLFG